MKMEQVKLDVEFGMDVTFVTFEEEKILDEGQIGRLQEAFEPIVTRNGDNRLILNFTNVRFMTSAVLGLLVRIHKKVAEHGGNMQLSNLDANLRRVFEITQLTKVFDIT